MLPIYADLFVRQLPQQVEVQVGVEGEEVEVEEDSHPTSPT